MRRILPVVFALVSLLLALGVAGAIDGQPPGYPYARLAVVSFAAYAVAGFAGASRAGFAGGLIAALTVGAIDAALTPLLAWLIGPGPLALGLADARVYLFRIVSVTATALGIGALGAVAAVVFGRRRKSAA